MKRIGMMVTSTLITLLLSGCGGLFPQIEEPTSPNVSLIAMEVGKSDGSNKTSELWLYNTAFEALVPHVLDENSNVVKFREQTAGVNVNNIFYAENVEPGTYTVVGFTQVYTDYGLQEDPNQRLKYAPYGNLPYSVKQLFKLDKSIKVVVDAGKMVNLGSYIVQYAYKEGMHGKSDDRWKANPESFKYVKVEPNDDKALRFMKPWATPTWKLWNSKNSAKPLN